MNRPTAKQVEDVADALALALISVLAYVVVTNPHAAIAAWLVAVIVPLLGVSLTASTARARRRNQASITATVERVDA